MTERREVRDERLEPAGPKWSGEYGPLYSVALIDDLPLGYGELKPGEVRCSQAMPSRNDLDQCRKKMKLDRVVAGYEILLNRFLTINDACLKLLSAIDRDNFATRLPVEEQAIKSIREAVVR